MPDGSPKRPTPKPSVRLTPYRTFSRAEWAALRADTPMTLTQEDAERLSGLTERVSLDEVRDAVLRDWKAAKARELRERDYAKRRKRYVVEIHRPVVKKTETQ